MKKENLLYKLTGTETPKFINERENVIIDKCLEIINDLESEVKNLTMHDVIKSVCGLHEEAADCKHRNNNKCTFTGKCYFQQTVL